jgi:L-alanine-DL-glutamate epimerase-like enolase superfamily enzyme
VKIVSVESFILHVPIGKFVTDSFNQTADWGVPGVVITTDEGITGTGYTGTQLAGEHAIKSVIDECFTPVLIGQDPRLHHRLWQQLFWSRAHWVGRVGITTMAHACVDNALWDIKAKAAGQPLWQLLGGHKDGRVLSYNTDGGWLNFSLDELFAAMDTIIEAGWKAVKMKVGGPDPREDYRRVKAVRQHIGDDIDLMIDANQVWDLTTARTWGQRFEEFNLRWFEEPLHPDDVRAHAELARQIRVPIALGEHVYSRLQFRDFLEANAISYVQADCTRLAGVTEWLEVAAIASAYNVPVVPHHADMMRVHQHLGVASPACPMIECIPWLQEIFEEPLDIREGWIHPGDTPGASTAIRKDKFEQYRVA